jgi:MFS family permease
MNSSDESTHDKPADSQSDSQNATVDSDSLPPFIEEYSDEAGRPASALPTESQLDEELPGGSENKHDPYLAWRSRDYTLFSIGGLFSNVGNQMQGVAVAWEIYSRVSAVSGIKQGAWALGLVGLIQALPVILLALPAGQLADKVQRKAILLITQLVLIFCWMGMAWLSFTHGPLEVLYLLLLFDGIANAIANPARNAFNTQLVPIEAIASATTWNSTRWQFSAVAGPALGGAAIAFFHGPSPVYLVSIFCAFIFIAFVIPLRPRPQERSREKVSLDSLLGGARFVWNNPIILATVTLDMFAVLLGGAVALLPIYAKDILHVGSQGYGWLLAAPAVGSVVTAFLIAHLPPMRRAGRAMLWAVVGFGLATIVFGLSRNFFLSFVALFATGACDAVSVVVRHTLVQVLTPDSLRGRVSAVNSVFIGISNEIGSFESGLAARLLGPVTAVVVGGIGTVLVTVGVAWKWPVVRHIGSLKEAADEFAAQENGKSTPAMAGE